MNPRPRALCVALLALAVVSAASESATPTLQPQQAQPAPGTPPVAETVGVTAARVAVDLVVRDKKGRLVRDLKASDIEVLEDGMPQEVLSVRLVDTVGGARALPSPRARRRRRPPRPRAPAAPGAAPAPDEHPLFLAFLFDRLSPQARRTAHDAAIEWLQRPAPAKRHVGVFRIDQTLETLPSFSDDDAGAVEAVDLILESAPTTYQREVGPGAAPGAASAAHRATG